MIVKTRLLAALALLFALVGAARAKEGDAAPDLTFQDAKGKDVKLASLAGSVIVVDFWATFCAPCKEELPGLDALAKKYAGARKPAVFLAVSVDKKQEKADKFIADAKLASLRFLYDLADKAGMRANLPSYMVIDKRGIIRYQATGYSPDTLTKIDAAVAAALK